MLKNDDGRSWRGEDTELGAWPSVNEGVSVPKVSRWLSLVGEKVE